MIQQRFHEGNISVPNSWVDDTLTVLKAPDHEGHNLVLSREPLPRGIDQGHHLEAQRKVIAGALDEFQESGRQTVVICHEPCLLLEYSWQSPEGPMFQANLMRVVGQTVLSFTFTSGRPFSAAQREDIREILASFVPAPEMERPTRS